MNLEIGNVVVLKVALLGNEISTLGVVYDLYSDFDGNINPGACIIFKNGYYDGFSVDEQERFLSIHSFSDNHQNYKFTNVMQLSRDYENGFWNDIF